MFVKNQPGIMWVLKLITVAFLVTLPISGCKLDDSSIKGQLSDDNLTDTPTDPDSPTPPPPPSPLQVGELDTTFNTTGIYVYSSTQDSTGKGLVIDSTGKIYVAGYYWDTGGSLSSARIWSLKKDGTVNLGFNITGIYNDTISNYVHGHSILINSSGNLVMGGYKEWGSRDDPTAWSLSLAGNMVSAFSADGIANILFSGLEVEAFHLVEDTQSTGYLTTGGQYHNYMALAKFTGTGGTDTSFGGGDGKVTFNTVPRSRGNKVRVDASGNVLVFGEASPTNNASNYDFIFWRYLPNGTLDTTFNGTGYLVETNTAGGADLQEYAKDFIIDSDGNYILVGNSDSGTDQDMVIMKIDATTGAFDPTFGTGGKVVYDNGTTCHQSGNAVKQDSDKNLLIAGFCCDQVGGSKDVCVWRYTDQGVLDTTFGVGGFLQIGNIAGGDGDEEALGMVLDANENIVITGKSMGPAHDDMFVIRIK